MRYWSRSLIVVALMAMLPINSYVLASEEKTESGEKPFYFGVFGGFSFPENATLRPDSPPPGVDFKGGLSGGLKTGWALPGEYYGGWFNWEFEYWYQNNKVKQLGTIPGANGHQHIFSSNFIVRRPTGKIQPYVGIGPSLVYADINGSTPTGSAFGTGNQSATSFGYNFLAGTRFKFTDTFGMFIEYKRNTAFNAVFDAGRYRYSTNVAAVGFTWDFESISLP